MRAHGSACWRPALRRPASTSTCRSQCRSRWRSGTVESSAQRCCDSSRCTSRRQSGGAGPLRCGCGSAGLGACEPVSWCPGEPPVIANLTERVLRGSGQRRASGSLGSGFGAGKAPVAGSPARHRYGRVMAAWDETEPGILRLPSGRLVRGRGLRFPTPTGPPPEFGLYLQGRPPPPTPWRSRWVRWPDWWLPLDQVDARGALLEVWQRAAVERVEVACSGGRGRTGTALACLAICDGVPPAEAVVYAREHCDPRAVETPWQRRLVKRFDP